MYTLYTVEGTIDTGTICTAARDMRLMRWMGQARFGSPPVVTAEGSRSGPERRGVPVERRARGLVDSGEEERFVFYGTTPLVPPPQKQVKTVLATGSREVRARSRGVEGQESRPGYPPAEPAPNSSDSGGKLAPFLVLLSCSTDLTLEEELGL